MLSRLGGSAFRGSGTTLALLAVDSSREQMTTVTGSGSRWCVKHRATVAQAMGTKGMRRCGAYSRFLIVALTVAVVLAGPGRVDAASLSLSWNAPTTNVDGTPLSDLGGYRVYLATTSPACPGGSFLTVSSPTTTPAPGQTIASRVTSLSAGTTYF